MYTIKYNLTPGKIKFISEETVKFSKYAAWSQSPQSQTSPPGAVSCPANHRTPAASHTKHRLSPHPKAASVFVRCCPLSSVVSGDTRVCSPARQAYCQQPPSASPPHQEPPLAAPKGDVRFCPLLSVIVRCLR